MKKNYIYWKCGTCGDKKRSSKKERHAMDWCKCGASAVDAEEWYSRFIGNPKVITKEEYESR